MNMFTETEQEEITREFLSKIEEKEKNVIDDFLNNNEPDEEDSYGFVTEKRLEQESNEHCRMLNNIKTEKTLH